MRARSLLRRSSAALGVSALRSGALPIALCGEMRLGRGQPARGVSMQALVQRLTGGDGADGEAHADAGLYGIGVLHEPRDFIRACEEVVTVSEEYAELVRADVRAGTVSRRTLLLFDLLSDTLCRIADAGSVCMHTHSSQEWRAAAFEATSRLQGLIARLNADSTLHSAMDSLSQDESLSAEERYTAQLLREENEVGGTHLDEPARTQMFDLQNAIEQHIARFYSLFQQPPRTYHVPDQPTTRAVLNSIQVAPPQPPAPRGMLALSTDPMLTTVVLRHCADRDTRREAFVQAGEARARREDALISIAATRHALAQTVGFQSFADMTLRDRMVGSPQAALQFLLRLAATTRPRVTEAFADLQRRYGERIGGPHGAAPGSRVAPWDARFLMQCAVDDVAAETPASVESYLPMPAVIDGLALVVQEVFGVGMEEQPMARGEQWGTPNGPVRKFILRDTRSVDDKGRGQLLGVLYLDLAARPGKTQGCSHYTVQSARARYERLPEMAGVPVVGIGCESSDPARHVPVAVVVASWDVRPSRLVLFNPNVLRSFFHEIGHAMHSLFSQTTFQHVSGTRTRADFVEVPSLLFENFAHDFRVVERFARHVSSGKPMPRAEWDAYAAATATSALVSLQTSLEDALFDLAIHSAHPMAVACAGLSADGTSLVLPGVTHPPEAALETCAGRPPLADDENGKLPSVGDLRLDMTPADLDPRAVVREITRRHSPLDFASLPVHYSDYTHMANYGAAYYTYCYDRVLAANVWGHLFAEAPLSPRAGARCRDELLALGGSRDPAEIIRGVLDGAEPSMDALLADMRL